MKSQIQINGVKMKKPNLKKAPGSGLLSIKKNEDYLSKKIAKLKKFLKNGDGAGRHIATAAELKEFLNVRIIPPKVASSSSIYHPCQGCFEIFRLANGLEDHMNRLSSQIIFRCFRCNNKELTFFNRCSLITHLKWSHNISQPNIKDLRNCTKIQALPGSYFKNYDHYNNLDLKQQEQEGWEFSCESESISNILNSNTSPIKTTLTFKTNDGNLFLIHESESANNYSISAPEQTSLYDDLSSSSPIISTTTATAITTTTKTSTDNSTFLSSTSTKISSSSSSSSDQDIVSNQEIEPVKLDEESDRKIILENGKSKKESKTAAADISDSGQLDQEINDDEDEDDDKNSTKNPKQLKLRRRPTPERKQPARNSASTSSLNRLTRSSSSVKLTKKVDKKVRSPDSDYKACVHCSISIPIKSLNRHESSCGHLKMITSGETSGDHFCSDCNLRFSSIKLFLLHKSYTHLPNENNIGEDLFICSLLGCSKQFRNIVKLKKHLTLGHKVKNVTRTDMMGMKKSSNTSTTANDSGLLKAKKNSIGVGIGIGINKEKTETDMTNSTEEKINGVKKASLVEKDGNVQKLVLEEKTQNKVSSSKARLENGFFNCLKCHCLFGSLDIFYEHIKSSHICFDEPEDYGLYELYLQNKTDWWCIECENQYVTKPSLLKHIKFQHADCHLGEINEYLDKIGYKKREQDPLKEHQCSVCRLQLSNTDDFETHLRSHGQAYLQFVREKRKSLEVLHQHSNLNPNPTESDHGARAGTKEAGTGNKKYGNKVVRRNLALKAY